MPIIESSVIGTMFALIAGQSCLKCARANGSTMSSAKVQRTQVSIAGGTRSATPRPMMVLPAQNSDVSASSR